MENSSSSPAAAKARFWRIAQGEGIAGVNVDVLLGGGCVLLDHLQKFLAVDFFIVCRFLEDPGQVLLPLFPCHVGIDGVPVAGLGFPGKGRGPG